MAENSEIPTQKDLKEFRELGYTRQEIADHFGVTLAQVKRWISELNVPKKVTQRSASEGEESRITRSLSLPADYGMTLMEKAQEVLGPRLVYKKHVGYFVDGQPRSCDAIVKMAGVKKDA